MPAPTPIPDDLRPSVPGRLSRRALRVLNTPPFRLLLTALALFLLVLLFLGA